MLIKMNHMLCAAAICCASLALYADPIASDDFEDGSVPSGWSGDAAVSNLTYTYTQAVGLPLTSSTHAKVLWVDGTAERAYTDSDSASRTIDLVMMAESLPDDELPDADGDEQFRVAFDTNGCINLYHQYDSANRWTQLSTTQYPEGTWVRITLNIVYPASSSDYAACQVVVDGSPCVTEYGYRKSDLATASGSWYKAATNGVKISAVDFTGVGGVDDILLAETSSYTASGSTATTNGVEYSWLAERGIAADAVDSKATATSAYTAKQAYTAGTDPYSATPLYVTNATFSSDNLVLTLNGYKGDTPTTYSLKSSTSPISSSNAGDAMADVTYAGNSSDNTTTATVAMPTGNTVTYIQVVAGGAVATTNQFGLFKVTSTNASTIISAPWVSLGADLENPEAMNVAKLVKTTNLTAGDQLILFDGSEYKSWVLNSGCTAWEPTIISSSDNPLGVGTAAGAADTTLARGQGILLVRQHPTSAGEAVPFYLYGQYTDKAASTTVSAGTTTILASPTPGATFNLSSITPGADDKVIVPSAAIPKIYTYSNSAWGYDKTTTTTSHGETTQTKKRVTNENTIEAGNGFWYKAGSSGGTTINW